MNENIFFLLQGYNQRFNNISKEFLLENLRYENGQWGVDFDTIGVPVFHVCYFDPFLPKDLEDSIRECNPDEVTGSCPENFFDEDKTDIVEKCESFTGLMSYKRVLLK